MKNYDYKILNPGGNKTALVNGTEFTKEEKAKINNEILDANPEVEQVGFLSVEENRLEMAGGEFCVNATRCAIYEILNGKEGTNNLTVSGFNKIISGGIDNLENVYAYLDIKKCIDEIIEKQIINGLKLSIVKLDGIWQIILEEEDAKQYINMLKTNEDKCKQNLKQLMANIITGENAIGIMLIEKVESNTKINPVVWVKTVDTLYYETACGSGSLAYAIYNYAQNGAEIVDLLQPSGYKISVELNCDGKQIIKAKVSGTVKPS